jgi:rRNA maturation protein Nop10
MNETTEKIKCPKCGSSEKIIPIIYRCKPGDYSKYREMEKRGECILAGCVLSIEVPKWFCKNCRLNIWESDLRA